MEDILRDVFDEEPRKTAAFQDVFRETRDRLTNSIHTSPDPYAAMSMAKKEMIGAARTAANMQRWGVDEGYAMEKVGVSTGALASYLENVHFESQTTMLPTLQRTRKAYEYFVAQSSIAPSHAEAFTRWLRTQYLSPKATPAQHSILRKQHFRFLDFLDAAVYK